MKVYIRNRQRLIKVSHRKVTKLIRRLLVLLRLPKAEVSVLFVGDRRMRILNRCHRGVDRSTDVLSFPQYSAEEIGSVARTMRRRQDIHAARSIPLGDIVINLHRVRREARARGLTTDEELKRLFIHGLLHLLGYDHERGRRARAQMETTSRSLSRKLAEDS